MSSGHLHNQVLIATLRDQATRMGLDTQREVLVMVGSRRSYADLVIRRGSDVLVVEAELSSRRVVRDVAKAAALGACELWILIPTHAVRRAVQRRLAGIGLDMLGSGIWILTQVEAAKRLECCFPLISGPSCRENNTSRTSTTARPSAWPGRLSPGRLSAKPARVRQEVAR